MLRWVECVEAGEVIVVEILGHHHPSCKHLFFIFLYLYLNIKN